MHSLINNFGARGMSALRLSLLPPVVVASFLPTPATNLLPCHFDRRTFAITAVEKREVSCAKAVHNVDVSSEAKAVLRQFLSNGSMWEAEDDPWEAVDGFLASGGMWSGEEVDDDDDAEVELTRREFIAPRTRREFIAPSAEEADAQALLASFLASGGSVVDGVAEEEGDSFDDVESDEEALERARVEEATLRKAPPLRRTPPSEDAAAVLKEEGAVRLANALSPETASALRAHVLNELESHRGASPKSKMNPRRRSGKADERFSAVLAPHADDAREEERRWDLRLRLTPVVRRALRELIRGPLGGVMEDAAGGDSTLYELAALVSSPGAEPQPLHADTLWTDGNGCLFTSFVALQAVTRTMGPTRFLLRSHTEAAHDQFEYEGREEPLTFLSEYSAACGLMEVGEATLYDGRVLHGGGANEDDVRVLFYVTFARADADAVELGNDEAYSLLEGYRERFTLGRLRALCEK